MPLARSCGIALLASLLAAHSGAADATLTVTVRDNQGVLPRAGVRATHAESGATRRAVADEQGVARFDALAPGRYELRASFPGFADSAEPAVVLADGETKSLALEMAVAQLSTTITVETETMLIVRGLKTTRKN
jgi:hypothetical protein